MMDFFELRARLREARDDIEDIARTEVRHRDMAGYSPEMTERMLAIDVALELTERYPTVTTNLIKMVSGKQEGGRS